MRERGRLLKRERERERRGEYENREGKGKSLKNRCAKLYAYNECENSVRIIFFNDFGKLKTKPQLVFPKMK